MLRKATISFVVSVRSFVRPSVCLVVWLKQDDSFKECNCPTLLSGDSRRTKPDLVAATYEINKPVEDTALSQEIYGRIGWVDYIKSVVVAGR
jgi:hypothetical protein